MVERKVHYVVYDVDSHLKLMTIHDESMLGALLSYILIKGWADNIQVQTIVCDCDGEVINEI